MIGIQYAHIRPAEGGADVVWQRCQCGYENREAYHFVCPDCERDFPRAYTHSELHIGDIT